MAIKASDVGKLRKMTGAGMMDCKNALTEANGNFEDATDILRKKGLEKAAKKADRQASQGLINIKINDNMDHAVMTEINCETDFVAKNEEFQTFTQDVANVALLNDTKEIDVLKTSKIEGELVGDRLTSLIAKIGENMTIKRLSNCNIENGLIEGYIHFNGSIGVLTVLKSESDNKEKLKELGKELCFQIAAQSPKYICSENIPTEIVDKEKEIFTDQIKTEEMKKPEGKKKPGNIITMIVEGKVKKFYKEVCLLEQSYVRESKQSISELVKQYETELGKEIHIERFERYELGE